MTDLFKDWIPSILQTKKYIMTPENEKEYVPYVVNRAISQNNDCILFVNEMNILYNLDKKLQYDYFINILKAKKRKYQKWHKAIESTDIDAIKEYYDYSSEKAKGVLRILSAKQLNYIKEIINKGGVIK